MQITVTTPDHVAAEVQARGLTPERYVETLIAEQANSVPLSRSSVTRLADLEVFFEEIAAQMAPASRALQT